MHSDDARNVLKVLTGGFVNVKLTADNTETYVGEISKLVVDAGVGLAVAVEWIETRLAFPAIAEFVEECGKEWDRRRRRARAIEQAQAHREPGMFACSTCEDRRTVEISIPSGALTVTPCPECDPEMAAYWAEGHYDVDHDVAGCVHPLCRNRQRTIETKARNRRALPNDGSERTDPARVSQLLDGARASLGPPPRRDVD